MDVLKMNDNNQKNIGIKILKVIGKGFSLFFRGSIAIAMAIVRAMISFF